MIAELTGLAILLVLSVAALWKPNVILFMVSAGLAMMLGLAAPDTLSSNTTTTTTDITIGLSLYLYSIFCIVATIVTIFRSDEVGSED